MRRLGFVLFVVGIAVASCFAARAVQPEPRAPGESVRGVDRLTAWWQVAGWPFLGGMVLVVAGGVIARRRLPKAPVADGSAAGSSDERSPETVLAGILAVLEDLPAGDPAASSEAIRAALDDVLETAIPEFLDHRDALVDRMGLAAFATMIGQFAGLERNVARAWSALTDEAYDEVLPCLERARHAGASALAELEGAGDEGAAA